MADADGRTVSVLAVRLDGAPPRVLRAPVETRFKVSEESVDVTGLCTCEATLNVRLCETDGFTVYLEVGAVQDDSGVVEEVAAATIECDADDTVTAIDVPSAVLPLAYLLRALEVLRGPEASLEAMMSGFVDLTYWLDAPEGLTDEVLAAAVAAGRRG